MLYFTIRIAFKKKLKYDWTLNIKTYSTINFHI